MISPEHLRLVGAGGELHLHDGAGLVSPDEGLVGAAPARHSGVTSEGKHDGGEDGGLAGAILSRQEGQTLVWVECECLKSERIALVKTSKKKIQFI